nr:hypothetical protein [uncultured Aminipila sp.]
MKRFIAIIMTLCLLLGMSSICAYAEEEGAMNELKWQEETEVPIVSQMYGAVAVDGKIYVVTQDDNVVEKNSIYIYVCKNKNLDRG